MVGAVRWRGFAIDLDRIKKQREEARLKSKKAPIDPGAVKRWFREVLDDDEYKVIELRGTKDVVLEELGGKLDEETQKYTDYWETETGDEHPVAKRARAVRDARAAKKEEELYDKLIQAGRFHASFVVIGTLSTRMSGSDGLNPQGIISSKYVRSCFTLADGELPQLDGGDFVSFEVCISAAVYKDKGLENDLKSGKKIHALLAESIYPDVDYDTIMRSKGAKSGIDYYTQGKRAVFGLNYGGNAQTLVNKLGVSQEAADQTFQNFYKKYPGVEKNREQIIKSFCSMLQPGGIGTKVIWNEPKDYIESLLGFRRYFTLENQICKALYDLANDPPEEWQKVRVKVVRRDREQTATGACRSALLGAAFALQGNNMRAAANHVIQSTGAGITKEVERTIWDIQPHGVHPWLVAPMNIHDEIMTALNPEISEKVSKVIKDKVAEYKPTIPLIEIDWGRNLKSWAQK